MNLRVVVVMIGALVGACGGNDAPDAVKNDVNTGASAGAGGTGAAASGGTTGTGSSAAGGTTGTGSAGTGAGAGGTAVFDAGPVTGARRACGSGVRCNPGATCGIGGTDDSTSCFCDPSGHFLCAFSSWVTTPRRKCLPDNSCNSSTDAGAETCTIENGFCVQTCDCRDGSYECSSECSGSGPESAGRVCDVSNCRSGSGSCDYDDGACKYSVDCNQTSPVVSGACD